METIETLLNRKYRTCQDIRMEVDGNYLDELFCSVSRDFIKIQVIGTINEFNKWTGKLNNEHELKFKHDPSNIVIVDYGKKVLEDVTFEADYDKPFKITLIWGL